jgi:hypothetical protein
MLLKRSKKKGKKRKKKLFLHHAITKQYRSPSCCAIQSEYLFHWLSQKYSGGGQKKGQIVARVRPILSKTYLEIKGASRIGSAYVEPNITPDKIAIGDWATAAPERLVGAGDASG